MSIIGLDPDGITQEFVEFYLDYAGLDPDDYRTAELANVWQEIERDGGNILLWYAVFRHRKDGAPDTHINRWPSPATLQRMFNERNKAVA